MNNFGVVEVAGQRRTVAPGWAYVPDNRGNNLLPPGFAAAMAAASNAHAAASESAAAAAASKNPRKRASRSQAGAGAGSSLALFSDLTSRQETKLRKELDLLGRDSGAPAGGAGGGSGRDGAIAIPAKAVKAQNKYTPNVRKILASQKTFANHLDDFNAFSALHENTHGQTHGHAAGEGAATSTATATSGPKESSAGGSSRRPTKKDAKKDKKDAKDAKDTKRDAKKGTASRRSMSIVLPAISAADVPMLDAPDAESPADKVAEGQKGGEDTQQPQQPQQPVSTSSILLPYTGPRPVPHPLDNDPLLVSAMPPLPADDELRALVLAPPLTYNEARASFASTPSMAATTKMYPTRVFCEICGYWGRVKCIKCGTPVCALDCMELHREDCITRYGM